MKEQLIKEILDYVDKKIHFKNDIKIAEVISVNYEKNTMKVKDLFTKFYIQNVRITTPFKNNGYGFYFYPEIGDFVIVMEYNGLWFNLCSLNNIFLVDEKDPTGKNKIKFTTNDVVIWLKDGAKIKLYKSGAFKLLNKGNYGIYCDENGNITISGKSINFSNSPIVWEHDKK